MANTFAYRSYRTQRDMLDAIVVKYMTADGAHDDTQVAESVATGTPEKAVADMIRDFELADHMAEEGYGESDLIAAATRFFDNNA